MGGLWRTLATEACWETGQSKTKRYGSNVRGKDKKQYRSKAAPCQHCSAVYNKRNVHTTMAPAGEIRGQVRVFQTAGQADQLDSRLDNGMTYGQ